MIKRCSLRAADLVSVDAGELLKNRKDLLAVGDITGLYILHNLTEDLYYVGQSVTALARASALFLGRGNKDIGSVEKVGVTPVAEWTV